MIMIRTENLSKIYSSKQKHVLALDELSISVNKGDVVGLLGPNGAGKSTTIKLLSTMLQPSGGTAVVNGYDIRDYPLEVRKSIGIALENPGFYERLSALENLDFIGRLYEIPKEDRIDRIHRLIHEFNLSDVLDRPVGTFSKGMKQKLLLIKVLLHDPSILLLDEPWAGLSPFAQRELRELIKTAVADGSKTVLISSHNLANVEKLADRLFIINRGKLIEAGTPSDLRAKYLVNPLIEFKLQKELPPSISLPDFVVESSIRGKFVHITVDSFEKTPLLIESLVQQGVQIHEVRELIPSLEDIYMDIVGGDVQ